MVASTAVIHTHRVCIARRDSLLLFNQKSFTMRANDESANSAPIGLISPEAIINDLIISDNISNLRNHLRKMLDAYLLSEDNTRSRQDIYCSFQTMDIMLKRVESVELSQERRVA